MLLVPFYLCLLFLFVSILLCVNIGQIIEYEDYDNTTNYHQRIEYEYEEEDERYGPAEREREFSLSTQVASKQSVKCEGICQGMSPHLMASVMICVPALGFT